MLRGALFTETACDEKGVTLVRFGVTVIRFCVTCVVTGVTDLLIEVVEFLCVELGKLWLGETGTSTDFVTMIVDGVTPSFLVLWMLTEYGGRAPLGFTFTILLFRPLRDKLLVTPGISLLSRNSFVWLPPMLLTTMRETLSLLVVGLVLRVDGLPVFFGWIGRSLPAVVSCIDLGTWVKPPFLALICRTKRS